MSHLILSRRPTESIVCTIPPSDVPTEIEVQVVRVSATQNVRLGFTAPRGVNIARSELRTLEDGKPLVLAAEKDCD